MGILWFIMRIKVYLGYNIHVNIQQRQIPTVGTLSTLRLCSGHQMSFWTGFVLPLLAITTLVNGEFHQMWLWARIALKNKTKQSMFSDVDGADCHCCLQAASSAHSECVTPGWVFFKERERKGKLTWPWKWNKMQNKIQDFKCFVNRYWKKLALANLFLNLWQLL